MTAHVISFEMTDALMSRAAREDCLSVARELARPRDLLIVLASTALFVSAVQSTSHWLWWFAGLPMLLLLVASLVGVAAYLWLPRLSASRLARLPHRQVRIEASEERLAFETATERLEVLWSELKALKRRPTFWFICLKSGARIPVPVSAVSEEARILLQARAASAASATRAG